LDRTHIDTILLCLLRAANYNEISCSPFDSKIQCKNLKE